MKDAKDEIETTDEEEKSTDKTKKQQLKGPASIKNSDAKYNSCLETKRKREEDLSDEENKKICVPSTYYAKCTNANINFSLRCKHCRQVICDGTTLSQFINSRIDYKGFNEYDASRSFINVYLLLKDYELFQASRFTDPDVEHDVVKLPKCIKDGFTEYYMDGNITFNQLRIAKKGKFMELEE